MNRINILLVDDHALLRSGLRMLIDSQADMHVIGEAENGQQLLPLVENTQPDVILLDLSMAGLGGLETLPLIRKLQPSIHILILTMHDDESYLRQALRDGASGYLLKRAADTELLSAIRAVMRGEIYVHPSMTHYLIDNLRPSSAHDPATPWDMLSERERDVLLRVARGHTSAKIADQLNLSPKTVETYRARGMEKLGLRSRAALVQFVLAHGLLSNDTLP